jgi:hypothetical protein
MRVATVRRVFRPNIDRDIWMFDASRAAMARVTFQPQLEEAPVWSAYAASAASSRGRLRRQRGISRSRGAAAAAGQ